MENRNQCTYKNPAMKLSVGTLALGSLLAIAGCNNSLVDNQPIKQVAEKPIVSKTENPSTPNTDKDYIGTQGLVDESVDPEIKYYLEQYNISIKEAERRMFISTNRDAAFEALQKEFSGRIAGSYIEQAPSYKYVLRIVGSGKDMIRQVKIYDRSRTGKYEVLPVEIKYGARFTKEEARLQQTKAANLASRYFSKLRMTGYNEEKGIIVADVHGKPTPENLELVKKVQDEWGQDKLPLMIKFVSYSISPL